MANAVYPTYKGFILTAAANTSLDQNTSTDGPFVALVDTGTYTYSSAHDFYNDITGVVGTDQRITTPTVSASTGVFDGDDVTFTAVSGASVEALVVYRKNSGANTTWKLVFYEDTGVTGLPVTPNGGDISITWNASGILLISDMRLKADVVQVGSHGPLPVYEYRYLWGKRRHVGVMAQDAERVAPDAVRTLRGGYRAVDYDRLAGYALAA